MDLELERVAFGTVVGVTGATVAPGTCRERNQKKARSQIPTVPTSAFTPPTSLDPHAFGHGGTSDVFLLKFSSWWAS